MTASNPRRLSRGQILSIVAIDTAAVALGLFLFFWLNPKDPSAALMSLIAAVVFGGFFSLVIVLVSLKP